MRLRIFGYASEACFIQPVVRSFEDAARDGPCAHGKGLLSLHNPVARAARALVVSYLAGRYTVRAIQASHAARGELTGNARPRFFESSMSFARGAGATRAKQ